MTEKEFQSVLLEDLEIRLPGIAVQRFGLNQHMPRVEKLSVHSHPHWQALLYLRGQGTQCLDENKIPIQRGSLLIIPPGERHRFVKSQYLRPVCLVIDFESDDPLDWKLYSTMADHNLKRIERLLVEINDLHRRPVNPSIPLAAFILDVLGIIQKTVRSDSREVHGPATRKVASILQTSTAEITTLTPAKLAAQFGVSLDHLNRMLHSESSPSVGKILAEARLRHCCFLLKESSKSVGEVSLLTGYTDQNYFARWFRKQTGQTPLQWRNAQNAKD